ncbi:somatostatin receptor type 4-like [Pecten maximus]|uniref:somatostatin receptor type 4-like n=1 Tax=Pecten maximus TaxID=6579 RepID=UPI00145844E0|nr:somatostatin receptor type 4-like [Pecten maximus]
MGSLIIDPATNKTVFTFFSEFGEEWPGQSAIEALALGVIMVFAFLGNGMVIWAIYRNPKMRKTTNYFIGNLAVADLLFALWIPFIMATRITRNWVFGNFICKLVTYVQFVSGISSILTLMMISIERFFSICLLSSKKMTKEIACFVILGIWILSSSFPIPIAWAQLEQQLVLDDVTLTYCGIMWPEHFHIDVYLSFMVTFFFIAPLMIILINYYKIFKFVRRSLRRTGRLTRSEIRTRRKLRLTKMFVAIVVSFVLMWSPFFVVSFLAVYLHSITSTQFTITIIVALANTGQNPIIYGFFNKAFRKEFKSIFHCERQLQPAEITEVSKKYVATSETSKYIGTGTECSAGASQTV